MQAQIAEAFHLYQLTAQIRDQLLTDLTDADLGFELPGNPMLGLLLAEHAAIERSYIESFKTYKQDWTLETDVAVAVSVQRLKDTFAALDAELSAALEAITDEDFKTRQIDRGGYAFSSGAQLHTLREAMLIMMAKASVYLRAMGKLLNERFVAWIG